MNLFMQKEKRLSTFSLCDYEIVQAEWKWSKGKTGLIAVMVFSAIRKATILFGRMRRYFACVPEAFCCSLNINRQRWPSSLLLNHPGRTADQYMTALIINKFCSVEIIISLYLYFTSDYTMKNVRCSKKICPYWELHYMRVGKSNSKRCTRGSKSLFQLNYNKMISIILYQETFLLRPSYIEIHCTLKMRFILLRWWKKERT